MRKAWKRLLMFCHQQQTTVYVAVPLTILPILCLPPISGVSSSYMMIENKLIFNKALRVLLSLVSDWMPLLQDKETIKSWISVIFLWPLLECCPCIKCFHAGVDPVNSLKFMAPIFGIAARKNRPVCCESVWIKKHEQCIRTNQILSCGKRVWILGRYVVKWS